MKASTVVLALTLLFSLSACENTDSISYPISDQPCSPDDQVLDVDARNCVPMAGAAGM
jgi:hypothetical protein